MIGEKFGRLTTLRRVANHPTSNNIMVLCSCECGSEVVAAWTQVRRGKTKSCGCLQADAARATGRASKTHGMRNTPEYAAWQAMLNRCRNRKTTNFKSYGARGIKVCQAWRESFERFFADMGVRPSAEHSIERSDVNGDYEPSNCRWATNTEQQRNKRGSIRITWNGTTLPVREWEDRLGFPKEVVYNRLKHGWSVDRALTEPLHTEKRRNAVLAA